MAREIPWLSGGTRFFGHAAAMIEDPHAVLARVRDECGDLGRVKLLDRSSIVASDPRFIERVIVEQPKIYSKRTVAYEKGKLTVGTSLLTSETGDYWLRQRRIAAPAFHRERIAAFAELIDRVTRETIDEFPSDVFDFPAVMIRNTARIIGQALFSYDPREDSDRAGEAIGELARQGIQRIYAIVDLPLWIPTPRNLRFKRERQVLDDLVFGTIAARRSGERKEDLLSMLMESVDPETGERMTDKQLRDEVITMFVAGHETTATLVGWCLYALLTHPEMVEKARNDAKFLDAVVQETLRLYPPVWMVGRRVEADDEFDGWRIPKGHFVFVSQWTTHRSPRVWDEPLEFKPERWLVEDTKRHKYAFFPFIGGPRKCIGDQLALLEARMILAQLLKRKDFTLEPGQTIVPDASVTLRMREGMRVRAVDRALVPVVDRAAE
jgi:cytochrome P450